MGLEQLRFSSVCIRLLPVTNRCIIGLFTTILIGCKPTVNPRELFAFPIREIEDVQSSGSIQIEQEFSCRMEGAWRFGVLDTIIITTKGGIDSTIYHVSGLRSGVELGHFVRRGRGPDEVILAGGSFQIRNSSIPLFDAFSGKYFELDVLESLRNGRTVYANRAQLNVSKGKMMAHPRRVLEDKVILFDSAVNTIVNELTHVPCFSLYDLQSGNKERDYNCFQKIPMTKQKGSNFLPQDLITIHVCTDRSEKRLCFTVNKFPLMCFLDLETGEARGVWIKGKPQFSVHNPVIHFVGCETDGERIYSLYHGLPDTAGESPQLYVFDWAGNILGQYQLDRPYYWVCVDGDKIILAARKEDAETDDSASHLYSIDIKEVEKAYACGDN